MNKAFTLLTLGWLSAVAVGVARATPLDISTWGTGAGVTVGGGVGSVAEQPEQAVYLYDDSFFIPTDAIALSFDYQFTLAAGNTDFLVAVIDFTNYLLEIGEDNHSSDQKVFSGSHTIDFTGLDKAIPISLAFGIESSDSVMGSFATFSNFDIVTRNTGNGGNALPEPATMLLLGTGLVGLVGAKRKKS